MNLPLFTTIINSTCSKILPQERGVRNRGKEELGPERFVEEEWRIVGYPQTPCPKVR